MNIKVLIATGLFPPDIGGPATYSKILAEELPKHNVGVTILSFGVVRKLPKIIRHLVYFFKVLKLGSKADVIFAQDTVSVGLPTMLAAKILRKRYILKIVGDYAWEQGAQRFGMEDLLDDFLLKKDYSWPVKFLRCIQKIVAQKADRIITPSEYLKTVVISWGIDAQKIDVIYNAVEFKDVPSIKHEGEKWIVSVGRLVPWKGFDTLIEVTGELSLRAERSNPNVVSDNLGITSSADANRLPRNDIKLKIVGSGPQFANLQSKIKNLHLESSVELLWELSHSETLSYIKSADVFVLNSGYEGLSHVILEALNVRALVLASNMGGNPELLPRENLFTYNNKEEIINKILAVLENKNNYLIDANVSEKFKMETMIFRTKETLEKLCAN